MFAHTQMPRETRQRISANNQPVKSVSLPPHLLAAVALGQRDVRSAGGHERVHIRVHATCPGKEQNYREM